MNTNSYINSVDTECENIIYSNEYADYIVEFFKSGTILTTRYNPDCIQLLSRKYAIIYKKITDSNMITPQYFGYSSFPKCYGLLDSTALEDTGVLKLRRQPNIDLSGQGILIGFVDTGIDYQNPIFQYADGTSRIHAIWDQTIPGAPPENFLYGTEFTREQLNSTITGIPLTNDSIGHGTMMAGIAAGNVDEANGFSGAAPLSDIVMVKLKQAKEYFRNYYFVEEGIPCYQENDILLGVYYLTTVAARLNRPLLICIGVGTNMGGHSGDMPLPDYLTYIGDSPGTVICTSGGNETNRFHHSRTKAIEEKTSKEVEVNVASRENGFHIEIWCQKPGLFSIGITSPTGEVYEKLLPRNNADQTINFILDNTTLSIYYELVESLTGDELILLRFKNPSSGIWRITIYNESNKNYPADLWLPMENFIKNDTYFIQSDPEVTICDPGNAPRIITCAAYNHVTGTIYPYSSRGYSRTGTIVPVIAAPGVNIQVPLPGNGYGTASGTSIACAHTAGICALLMEWGLVKGNNLDMDTNEVLSYLISGAVPTGNFTPNPMWGYGKIDIFSTFQNIRPGGRQ